nr:DMT family transporter [Peptoniphilus sp. KCTC 25270]
MRGNLMLTLTAFIWGTAFVAQISGGDHIGPFAFNFSRNIIATLFLFILIQVWPMIMKRPIDVETEEMKRPTLIGGIACGVILTAAMAFQQVGIVYTTAGKAGFITSLYIVLVPLAGIFLGKRIGFRIWFCVALAAVGLYMLSIKAGFTMQFGDLLILICAFCYTLHILVIDYFSPKSHGTKLSMIQFLVAGILSGIIMLFLEDISMENVMNAAIPILYTGVLSSGVGYTFQILAQKDTDPTTASLLMSLESVFAVLAGAVLLGERLSIREGMGCILMFVAIILAQIPMKRRQKEII